MATEQKPKGGVRYSGNATIRATYDPALQGTGDFWHAIGGWRVTVSAEGRVRWRGIVTVEEVKRSTVDSWSGAPLGVQTVYMRALAHAIGDDDAREHVRPNVETVTERVRERDRWGGGWSEKDIAITRWAVKLAPDTYTDHPAFSAMLDACTATGLPRSFDADVRVHDRRQVALLAHKSGGGPLVFAWCLRDCGSHIATDAKDIRSIANAFGHDRCHWYLWASDRLRACTQVEAELAVTEALADHASRAAAAE